MCKCQDETLRMRGMSQNLCSLRMLETSFVWARPKTHYVLDFGTYKHVLFNSGFNFQWRSFLGLTVYNRAKVTYFKLFLNLLHNASSRFLLGLKWAAPSENRVFEHNSIHHAHARSIISYVLWLLMILFAYSQTAHIHTGWLGLRYPHMPGDTFSHGAA